MKSFRILSENPEAYIFRSFKPIVNNYVDLAWYKTCLSFLCFHCCDFRILNTYDAFCKFLQR